MARRDSEEPTFTDTIELDLAHGRAEHRRSQAPAGPDRSERRAASPSARRSAATSSDYDARDEADAGELSRRATPPPTATTTRAPPTAARATSKAPTRAPSRSRSATAGALHACRRHRGRARPRPRRDRGDHELHQHLQPVGHDRRGHPRAQRASRAGLRSKPWVKTSLAPGSKVVTEYLDRAGLTEPLEQLGFNLVGYGCTTCIGNSGPLPDEVSKAVNEADLAVASVLSGNRNFEGRINPDVKLNYLASPPLCVAYALAGTMDIDIVGDPLGAGRAGSGRLPQGHLALRAGDRRDDRRDRPGGHVPQELRRGVRRR